MSLFTRGSISEVIGNGQEVCRLGPVTINDRICQTKRSWIPRRSARRKS